MVSASISTTPFLSSKSLYSVKIVPELLNPRETMHGGAVALLVDMATTLAVAPLSTEDFWHFGGVSRTMSITYLRPIVAESVLWVECEVKAIGKRLGE